MLDHSHKPDLTCNQESKAPDTPYILEMPVDILSIILDLLELHDEFFLSQTCRAFRALTGRVWSRTVNELPHIPRVEFMTQLARRQPKHWVCQHCSRLHKLNRRDVPGNSLLSNTPGAKNLAAPYPSCQRHRYDAFDPHYRLRHAHIQLALKLNQAQNIDQRHYKKIMTPVALSWHISRWLCTFSPKIVSGRFLLQAARTISAMEWRTRLEPETLCPHISVPTPMSVRQNRSPGLFDDIALHMMLAGHGQSEGSCLNCPTDYLLFVHQSWIYLWAWYDFGSCQSPMNAEWRALVYPDQDPVHHISGSIQSMYQED